MLVFLRKLWTVLERLKGGASAVVAMPFRVNCECGHRVSGVRRASWIEAECKKCCQTVFILPANVYPATKNVPSSVLGGGLLERLRTIIADVFPPPEPKRKTQTASKSVPAPKAAETPPTGVKLPGIRPERIPARIFTPFRLVMLTIISIVGITSYWVIHQHAIEDARQTWLRTSEQIPELMRNQSLLELEGVLEDAVQSGQLLGEHDGEWRLINNLLSETRAVNALSSADLLTAFHQAYDKDHTLQPDAALAVESAATSGFFIFDSYLQPGNIDGAEFAVVFPAAPGIHSVELVIPLPALNELFELQDDHRIIFAGRISNVRIPQEDSIASWRLTIATDSFALLTSPEHCATLGLTVAAGDPLETLLNQQREFVKESAKWEHRLETIAREESTDNSPAKPQQPEEASKPEESAAR